MLYVIFRAVPFRSIIQIYKKRLIKMSPPYRFYYYSVISVAAVSIILNGLGLFAIYSYKKKTNQNLILSSLSLLEIAMSLYRIAFEVALYYLHALTSYKNYLDRRLTSND